MTATTDPEIAKTDLQVTESNDSSKHAAEPVVREGTTEHLPSYEHEKALCLKLDFRILPMLALMYLFNALDKGNLGNAKTDGMDKDLGFKGNQYNTMLSIFYVPYVLFAPPIGMLGKKYGPHRVLPIMMFSFGSATLLSASVKNWSGMMALRWFLGELMISAFRCGMVMGVKLEAFRQRSLESLPARFACFDIVHLRAAY
jgi:MFS family permease